MITCIIIDDEQPAINVLEAYTAQVPYLKLVGTTTSPLEGLRIINERQVDLIFLDIQMPGLTGLDFIRAINGKCRVIFTTAYDHYAVDGFELDAIDYLLKPVPFPRFLKAVQKAKDLMMKPDAPAADMDFITVQGDSKGKLIKIEVGEIDYIEGMRNYVAIVCGGKKILTLMNMKDLEENLAGRKFVRVHKSYIIPIANVASVEGNVILLKRNSRVDIVLGSAYKAAFLEIMKSKMVG